MAEKVKISVQNLSKSFGHKMVLNQVSLDVAEKESLVIIGGSGTGKSVFIKCVMGLLEPDKDSVVKIDNENITNIPIIKRKSFLDQFGMLFQGGALFDSLRVWENVAFRLLQNKKLSKEEAKKIAKEKLGMVSLNNHILDLYPAELSGGMQKRVALARAIANNPSIIFFDEPTSGLDPITAQVITDLISSLSKDLGATTLTITHDMRCVKMIADKVAMIYQGKIVWHGQGKNIEYSNNDFVDQFIHGKSVGPISFQ